MVVASLSSTIDTLIFEKSLSERLDVDKAAQSFINSFVEILVVDHTL